MLTGRFSWVKFINPNANSAVNMNAVRRTLLTYLCILTLISFHLTWEN